jgi:Rieske Fe-S protein
MTPRQLLVVAVPLLSAIFVLFLVLIATSRRRTEAPGPSVGTGLRIEEALTRVPGGVETQTVEGESRPTEAAATVAHPEASAEAGKAPAVVKPAAAVELLGAEPGEAPSGDGQRAWEFVGPQIELQPLEAEVGSEAEGMTRRQVLNRGILLTLGASLTSFGGAVLAFLWPKLSGGFGSVIAAGNIDEIKAQIKSNREPFYNAAGRFYLMTYETNLDDSAGDAIYPRAFSTYKQAGLIALYQKCPHLGCRVPWCKSSQWFECPCHGSKYNAAGEWQGGPAPRGMWHFPIKLQGSTVLVDTGTQIVGPPKGTNTPVDPSAKGPHCVGI